MCSVSWVRIPDGYHLIFNRDERISRLPARPPEIRTLAENAFISPTDGDFGGTWIAVNQNGLSIGLVNFYPDVKPALPNQKRSRGFIIPDLISHTSSKQVEQALESWTFDVFEPFELLVFDATEHSFILRWDGFLATKRKATPAECPLASSSFVTREVVEYRKKTFASMMAKTIDSVETQRAFHTELRHPDRAYNPRMLRNDAKTVSITEIRVTSKNIVTTYFEIQNDQISRENRVECEIDSTFSL